MAKKTDKVSLKHEEEKKTKKEQTETEKAKGAKRKRKRRRRRKLDVTNSQCTMGSIFRLHYAETYH